MAGKGLKKNAADDEFDSALGGSADALPVVDAPLPKVSKVADLTPHPKADEEFEAALAAPSGPRPATIEEANSDVMPEGGKVAELPVQNIQSEVPKPEKPWYSRLLTAAGFPEQPKGFNPGDSNTDPNFKKEVAGLEHMQNMAARPGTNLAANMAQPLAAAVPGGIGAQALTGGALSGLNAAADRQPVLPAVENGVVLGGALAAGGQAARAAAKKAYPFADRLMTQVFMSPAQRAIYARQHGGSEALSKLGADARDAGMYKPANWLDYLHPTTARRVAENAERVQGEAGQTINDFEDQLAERGVNPDVPVAPIAQGLRQEAKNSVAGVADPKAARDAAHFTTHADLLDNERQLQTSASRGEQQLGMNEAEQAHAAELDPNHPDVVSVRENMPFTEAMKNKRYMANQIKWGQNPNAPGVDYGEDAARRFVWSGLKQNIGKALGHAANEGQIDKNALANYVKANKDFSTAATVQQPAMRMAERAGETGLGLGDLMAGASFGAPTALASRFARGMAPSSIAAGIRGAGAFSEGLGQGMSAGARVAPIATAQQQNPGAPKAVVEKKANESLKDQVRNWFDSLLK